MNQINVICPYRYNNVWVFDDPSVGLVREPFVMGVPEMIDFVVGTMEGAEDGFLLYFSSSPFPDYMFELSWDGSELEGNWYRAEFLGRRFRGWLCPALLRYFDKAPERIYVKVESVFGGRREHVGNNGEGG